MGRELPHDPRAGGFSSHEQSPPCTFSTLRMESVFPLVAQGSRTASGQAWWQLCALPLTLILASLGGSLTGEFLLLEPLPRDPPHACPRPCAPPVAARWQGKPGERKETPALSAPPPGSGRPQEPS